MRPQGDYILRTVATTLATKYLPMLEVEHAKSELGLTALLMGVVSEEFERAAHRRIEENRALRKIFLEALPVVEDEDLKRRLNEAIGKEEKDFHVSALDKLNCELQEVLIELHASVETLDGEDARNLEKSIWQELERGVKRREFMTWEMASAMLATAAPKQED